jgi:hypothetical protein
LQVGDRVRLSELGESRMSRSRAKSGTVVGFGYSDSRVRVQLDGRERPVTLHRTYLIRTAEAPAKRRNETMRR